ncbi:type II RES/Xre toxin-antitoxin system antitoxin [Foetidibacter luteolus]|uniref:type II RES/Xre toxin-antitoxin system antitoxin n=1 Tax=Foetidibacter luteolus TaxID=2608880 RepID=UPI00129ACBEE|nr:hypothetical protein [Foetidibacter luteolus]
MAKKSKITYYTTPEPPVHKVEEPEAVYQRTFRMPAVKDFPYSKFEKIAQMIPFTQKEWAGILHLSEKTLQRYSKDDKNFEGIYVDRILHVEQLIRLGLETFTSPEALYRWLKKEKNVLGLPLNFESLYSTQGIQDLIDQLGRIQYGVYT